MHDTQIRTYIIPSHLITNDSPLIKTLPGVLTIRVTFLANVQECTLAEPNFM